MPAMAVQEQLVEVETFGGSRGAPAGGRGEDLPGV